MESVRMVTTTSRGPSSNQRAIFTAESTLEMPEMPSSGRFPTSDSGTPAAPGSPCPPPR